MARPPLSTPACRALPDPDALLRRRVMAYLDQGATIGPDPDAPRHRVRLMLRNGGWFSLKTEAWERVRPR